MPKEQVKFRVDADIKKKACQVLNRMGMRPTDAVNMLLHHIALFKELPFKPRMPNAETQEVFAQTDACENITQYGTVDEIFKNI